MQANTHTETSNGDLAAQAIANAFAALRKIIAAPFNLVRGWFDFGKKDPDLVIHRRNRKKMAVYFIHGFTGDAASTWGDFPKFILEDTDLTGYDVFAWRYPTKLNPLYAITKYFWTDDPKIETIGAALRTLLNTTAKPYEKIVLVGHSMGGLAIQSFIIEEIGKNRSTHLDRLTEVVLFGTPSGGLVMANIAAELKNQIADMDIYGAFIEKLRAEWKRLIDDRRSDPTRIARFRLTVVAGLADAFVPPASSLGPFPFDEQEHVPGNHTMMIKPLSPIDRAYEVLKERLTRRNLTKAERELIYGECEEAILIVNSIIAAARLSDTQKLLDIANQLLAERPPRIPRAERAAGLALLEHQQYQQAAELLARYVDFDMPDENEPGQVQRPFRSDTEAVQQLAIALSRAGSPAEAVARLEGLPPAVRNVPESLGIYGGVLKRRWAASGGTPAMGWEVYAFYNDGFELAKAAKDSGQAFYNGINAAYMSFALGNDKYKAIADEVRAICEGIVKRDYWSEATRAEALLYWNRYADALSAYNSALTYAPSPRHWSTTGQQALDIISRQNKSEEASEIIKKFADIKKDI